MTIPKQSELQDCLNRLNETFSDIEDQLSKITTGREIGIKIADEPEIHLVYGKIDKTWCLHLYIIELSRVAPAARPTTKSIPLRDTKLEYRFLAASYLSTLVDKILETAQNLVPKAQEALTEVIHVRDRLRNIL